MDNSKERSPKILVIGDLMIDHYLWGKCDRISPEAPVAVVDIEREESLMGGAGNVINNLLSLGAKVGVASVIGDDDAGDLIEERLNEKGVLKVALLRDKDRKTTKKSRVIALHQQIVRVDREDRDEIKKSYRDEILKRVKEEIDRFDLLLLSDYGKGVLGKELTREIISLSKSKKIPIFVDPKGSDYSRYEGATLITPNKKEASIATRVDIKDDDSLIKAGVKLREELGLEYAFITLSEDGMAIFSEEGMQKIPTVAREVFDVTGAGDTVIAALGFAVAKGESIKDAASFANAAAAVAVSRVGSVAVRFDEVERFLRENHSLLNSKIVTLERLHEVLQKSKRVVFTNGCFDILHAGHVKYLKEAKSFGDILIVGLNSDTSVKRLKGEGRPINCQSDRAEVLAALESVDFVVIFDEDTPYNLIKEIKPDILVKGGDYRGKEVVGSDIAKETKLVDFVDGKSTTNIINKAKGSLC
jgi:D-beta-D-heptose 7-phosphate kinase/D-beta-D-heptose 1-phosphate adenosyltransferase